MKRALSLALAVMLTAALFTGTAYAADWNNGTNGFSDAASNWGSNYKIWSQGAADYGSYFNQFGCWVVAMSKLIMEADVAPSGFNPGVFLKWEKQNGYINSGFFQTGKNGSGYAPTAYAESQGKKLPVKSYGSKTQTELLELLKDNYLIVQVQAGHYAYVARDESLKDGKIYYWDSWSSQSTTNRHKTVPNKQAFTGWDGSYKVLAVWAYAAKNSDPIDVPATSPVVQPFGDTISAAYFNVYAIKEDGSLWSWNGGESKQILTDVTSVKGDYAVTSDGSLWELRNRNDHTDSALRSPVKIMDGVEGISPYFGAADTSEYTGVVKTDGSLWVMSYWQNDNKPAKILDSGVASVTTGGDFLLIIKDDASLWIWDEIYKSDGSRCPRITKLDDDVAKAECINIEMAAVLKNDGSLWAWSYGAYAYGDPSIERISMLPLMGMDNIKDIFPWSSLALDATGHLWLLDIGWYYYTGGTDWEFDGYEDVLSFTSEYILDDEQNVLADIKEAYGSGYRGIAVTENGDVWEWSNWWTTAEQTGGDILHVENGTFYFAYIETDRSLWVYGYGVPGMDLNDTPTPIKIFDNVALPNQNTSAVPNLDSAASWAHDGIVSAISKGFVPSDLQNNYTDTVTRQDFCRMAVKWLEYKTGKSIDALLTEQGKSRDPNAFTDTTNPDILAAYALGITNGTGNNQFTPNGNFTREQAATMIRNTCKAAGMDVSNIADAGFTDIGSASSWAVDGINFVKNAGIMGGTSATSLVFSPTGMYSRQESIVTFDRISK